MKEKEKENDIETNNGERKQRKKDMQELDS